MIFQQNHFTTTLTTSCAPMPQLSKSTYRNHQRAARLELVQLTGLLLLCGRHRATAKTKCENLKWSFKTLSFENCSFLASFSVCPLSRAPCVSALPVRRQSGTMAQYPAHAELKVVVLGDKGKICSHGRDPGDPSAPSIGLPVFLLFFVVPSFWPFWSGRRFPWKARLPA